MISPNTLEKSPRENCAPCILQYRSGCQDQEYWCNMGTEAGESMLRLGCVSHEGRGFFKVKEEF